MKKSANSRQVVDEIVVSLSLGEIVGEVHAGNVCHFSGLPFAAPPVGKYRWKRPRPASPWIGRLDATRRRPAHERTAAAHHFYDTSCEGTHGDDHDDQSWEPKFLESEDCLHASVWAPKEAIRGSNQGLVAAPVIVYIYGGGLSMGCCTEAAHSGAAYARRGCVAVSFNYRLGPLGWFQPHGGDANCGLWDAVALLRWVQIEAGAFGGDPNNVTLIGQSAGSDCCMWLCASPLANCLFHRAIIESPGSLTLTADQAHEIVEEFASVARAKSASLEDLQALTVRDIKRASARSRYVLSPNTQPGSRFEKYPSVSPDATLSFTSCGTLRLAGPVDMADFAAIIDGELLMECPLDAIAHGVASHLDVIVGLSRFECWGPQQKVSLSHLFSWELIGSPGSCALNDSEFHAISVEVEAAYGQEFKSGPMRLDTSTKHGAQRAKDALVSDLQHGAVSYLALERLAVHGNCRRLYGFEFLGTNGKNSLHGVQFSYTYGACFKGKVNRQLRELWLDAYAAFAALGDPNIDSLHSSGGWREYRGNGGPMMQLDTKNGCHLSIEGFRRRYGLHTLAMTYERLWKLEPILKSRLLSPIRASRTRKIGKENQLPTTMSSGLKVKKTDPKMW